MLKDSTGAYVGTRTVGFTTTMRPKGRPNLPWAEGASEVIPELVIEFAQLRDSKGGVCTGCAAHYEATLESAKYHATGGCKAVDDSLYLAYREDIA